MRFVRMMTVLFGIHLLMGASSMGQIEVLDNRSEFSSDRVVLSFASLQAGAVANEVFTAYGVRFDAVGGGVPTIGFDAPAGQAVFFLSNQSDPMDAATSQLIVSFSRPVREVGFLLRHEGPDSATFSFTFYNPLGDNLGSFQDQIEPGAAPFVGFRTPQEEEFSRVVVSYGESPGPEQLVELVLTYVEPPTFDTFVSQVADGVLPGGGLRTGILIANLANTTNRGRLALFGDDGNPLQLELNGAVGSEFDLNLTARAVQIFETAGGSNPPVQGYAVIETDLPASATGIFQILNSGGDPISEAGVEATTARRLQVATVIRQAGISLDSGIAVANVTDQPASALVQLLDANGSVVASNGNFASLGPRQHAAGFLPVLFPGVSPDFRGTILISSDQPLAVAVLRTVSGIVLSSLPVGSVGR